MKDWWKIAFGVLGGLLGAGLILLVSNPMRGEAITLSPPPTPAPIVVHVTGAVAHPEVYTLPVGSRLQDAIDAAGGLLSDANPQALNLASFLQDGERVVVPTLPVENTPAAEGLAPSASETHTQPLNSDVNQLININTATQAELESLPGIGPVTARKIIAHRESNGPFAKIEDIQDVSGIGPKTFESIKDLISVDILP